MQAPTPAPKGGKSEQGRAVVIGDSDVLSDAVLQNPGNLYLAADSTRWLLGDDAVSGTITAETDAPIQHTRAQDVAWFYSTIFAAPALVLAAGFGVTRRKRRSRSSPFPPASLRISRAYVGLTVLMIVAW